MSKHWLFCAIVGFLSVAFVECQPLAAADVEEGFKCMFDGKTLTGWEGKPDFWSVKDGAITGQTTAAKPTSGNTFIVWRGGKPADFELRLKFRMEDNKKFGNSGIQYRSVESANFVVGGYQADVDLDNTFTGIIYEERGRGIIGPRGKKVVIGADGKREDVGQACDEKALIAAIKKGEWNDYVIIAKGNHLIQKINGITTVELTDNEVAKRRMDGIIALQLHAGPPMLVQFKDLRIKDLK